MEISANELRIGNCIIEPGQDEDKPFQIFSIYHEDKNNKVNGLPIALMQPIPLTEDWLIRFGFEKFRLIKGGIVFDNSWLRINESMVAYWRGGFIGKIQHVNSLQNLYFALTGSELTLKN